MGSNNYCSKLNRYCLRKEKRVMKFIQYSLAGRIIEEAEFSGASFDAYPIGQKVRITTCDEKIYVGFWGTFMEKIKFHKKSRLRTMS